MTKAVLISDIPHRFIEVYPEAVMKEMKSVTEVYGTIVSAENANEHIDALSEADFLFSTWGVPIFPEEIIDKMKNLKCVFHAAGSVKHFANPYMARGVKIVNAAKKNGDFVTGYAFSLIYLALKGFFVNLRIGDKYKGEDIFENRKPLGTTRRKVGIIGAGNIGKGVMKKLLLNDMQPLVYDPYFSEEEASKMGAKKATLEEIFSECQVISNHAPNTPETVQMIGKKHFELMKSGATFINTGRGATIVEEEMAEVLSKRKDIIAIIDVVTVKPLPEESPLNRLDNLFRSPHIAGVNGSEESALSMSCVDELKRYLKGEPLTAEVTPEMLATMA